MTKRIKLKYLAGSILHFLKNILFWKKKNSNFFIFYFFILYGLDVCDARE